MTTYAVGDIQGCLKPLEYLLAKVSFNPSCDNLWLVGDVVNRGQNSLAVLRKLYNMQDCVTLVLGNHDLHLLACNLHPQFLKKNDTLTPILQAHDCSKLLYWLQNQPLMHLDQSKKIVMVHAGILPLWSLEQAQVYSEQIQQVLTHKKLSSTFLSYIYGNEHDCNLLQNSSFPITNLAQLRFITNVFTRIRFCNAKGQLDLSNKGAINSAPQGFAPWFEFARKDNPTHQIVFGHWAALEGKCNTPNFWALDTGYIWGKSMRMLNLDTLELISCPQIP